MPETPPQTDVIVVGAGPAGAACALELARAGVQVVLLERARWPRYKTCGGGLVGRALNELSALGIEPPVQHTCRRALLAASDAGVSIETERTQPIVTMTMRSELDACLVSGAVDAGVRFLDATSVGAVESDATGTTVTASGMGPGNASFQLRAPVVVAADGALSPTLRAAGFGGRHRGIAALEFELRVDDATRRRLEGVARFDFGVIPRGYAWIFPKADHISAGVLSVERGTTGLIDHFRSYARALDLTIEDEERHGFVIPLAPRSEIAHRGVLAVGDAAGLADPVTAEGISFALRSGRLAARSIARAALDPAGATRAYVDEVASDIAPELRAARWAARALYGWPALRRTLFRAHGSRLCEAMTDVMAGSRSYRELLGHPANYAKLLRVSIERSR